MPPTRLAVPAPVPWPLCVLLAMLAGGGVLATAWISDDALVTFRTVENFVAGEGLRWNVQDRCQTATHPLWVLVLAAGRACTGELYFTAIGLGVFCSALAVLLLARTAAGRGAAVAFAGFAVLGSRSYVEFGTCGLENPLVYLLGAAFAQQWFGGAPAQRRLRRLGTLGALLVLARQDLVLLVLPCVVAGCRGLAWRGVLRALLPGAALGAAWYSFALVYYGTIVPTPGHGKVVSADVPAGDLVPQGLFYLADLCLRDPVTALALAAAVAAGAATRRALFVAPALGVLLQVAYTLRVGGDFMSGRFFTAAFVLALASLLQFPRLAVFGALAALAATCATGLPPWLRGTPTKADYVTWHGIGNERAWYAQDLGLWSAQRFPFTYAMFGRAFGERPRPVVLLAHAAGVPGYLNGPFAHIVDPFLCDPLLMRLPLQDPLQWRIGHFKRRLPEGYLETLASGENRIRHPALARYWDALAVLLRAPVFAAERWSVWLAFQRGDYDGLLEQYVREAYRSPPRVAIDAAQLPPERAAGAHWYDGSCVVVREGGLRIAFGSARAAARLRLLIDGGAAGEIVWRRGTAELARTALAVPLDLMNGARWIEWAVPAAAGQFDAVDIDLRVEGAATDTAITMLEICAVLAVDLR